MKTFKAEEFSAHSIWINAGKPRRGPIFLNRNKAKYKYQMQIKENKAKEKLLTNNK